MLITDVRLLLRLASSDAIRPRVCLGSAVAVECTVLDQDGTPVAGAVVSLSIVGLLTVPDLVANAAGVVTASFTPPQAAAFVAQAECTSPLAALAQRTFDVVAADGDVTLSPPWVDARTGALIFPPGYPVTAQRIDAELRRDGISIDVADAGAFFNLKDALGFLSFSYNVTTGDLRAGFGRMSRRPDGSMRLSGFDEAPGSIIDLRSDGIALPGVTLANATGSMAVDFLDPLGFRLGGIGLDGAAMFGGFRLHNPGGIPTLSTGAGHPILAARGADKSGVTIDGLTIYSDGRADPLVAFVDQYGFWIRAITADGSVIGAGASSAKTGFTEEEIAAADLDGRLAAAELAREVDNYSQRPIVGINHIPSDGQSLSNGGGGTVPPDPEPVRTRVAPFGSVRMVGNSVRFQGRRGVTTWAPVGGSATLTPMIATSSAGNGETLLEQALAHFKVQQSAIFGVAEDTARVFVGTACGWGGQTVEQLSRGAIPDQFNRLPTACSLVKGLAEAAGAAYAIPALLYVQGEANYGGVAGTADRAAFAALTAQLFDDFDTHCTTAIAGQAAKPAKFVHQTSSVYVRDDVNMSISMAWIDLLKSRRDVYVVGPTYAYVKWLGHLTGNGYAWMGQQTGKVMDLVLNQRRRWRPLMPISFQHRGRETLITFHVPVPPLQWRHVHVGRVATMFPQRGFSCVDDAGNIPCSAEIVGDVTVRVTRTRDVGANGFLSYGARVFHSGHGNLFDSDATVATATYEWFPDMPADDNIAALVGKPYPLNNASLVFREALPAAWEPHR